MRSDPVEGIPQYPPGAGRYEIKREFDEPAGGYQEVTTFGRSAAHGNDKFDLLLTSNDQQTIDLMLARKKDLTRPVYKDRKSVPDPPEGKYEGDGTLPIRSSVSNLSSQFLTTCLFLR